MQQEQGATVEDPLAEQRKIASDAIEAAIHQMTVGIVHGSGENKWQYIGTGTFVRWRGRHFILTAEHVVRDTLPEDFRFFFRHERPLIPVERDVLLRLPGVPTSSLKGFTELEVGRVVMDKELDLAVIEINSNLEEKHPCRFFDLAAGGRSPDEGQQTIFMGFPFDVSRVTKENFRVIFAYLEWTNVGPNRTHLTGFDPARHFLAPYVLVETHPKANPEGISGGAMWRLIPDTSVVWHPTIDLAGVSSTWYPRIGILKIVRREIVEEFLTANVIW